MRMFLRPARVNVKALLILVAVIVVVGAAGAGGYKIRKRIIASTALKEGRAACEHQDWPTACKELKRYLEKYPDDIAVLRQYAEAHLAVRPLEAVNVSSAIGAYRRLLRLDPPAELASAAYKRLAALYEGTGNYDELAYIAERRLTHVSDDGLATLWLARARIAQRKFAEARAALEALVGRLEKQERKDEAFGMACWAMADLVTQEEAADSIAQARDWLDRAVAYDKQSASALARRARFRNACAASERDPAARKKLLATVQEDLNAATALAPTDPRVCALLVDEWLRRGDLERAATVAQMLEKVDPAKLTDEFLDPDDWLVVKFQLRTELARRQGAPAEGVRLADEALAPQDPARATLKYRSQRLSALPAAIQVYLEGGKLDEAQRCLNEYVGAFESVPATPEREERIALLKANVARATQRPYEVIELLEPLATREHVPAGAWRALGEAFAATDQPRRAIRAWLKYLEQGPRDPQVALQVAREYMKLGDWRRALQVSRLADAGEAADVRGTLERLQAARPPAADRPDAATRPASEQWTAVLDKLRDLYPNRVEVRLLQAVVAAQGGHPDAVEEELKLAAAECSDTLPAELQLIYYYLGREQTEEALAVARAACKRHANQAAPWVALANVLQAAQRAAEACEALQEGLTAMQEPPEQLALSLALGQSELRLPEQRATGLDRLKRLAAGNEKDIAVRTALLDLPDVQEDRPYAQALIDELRQIEGQSGLRWRRYRAAFLLTGDDWRSHTQEISDLLAQCISADPQWAAPTLLLGRMHERLGGNARAEELYRAGLRQNPRAIEVADRLLNLLERQGRFAEARQVLVQLEADPQTLATRRVGLALWAGQHEEAIQELEQRVAANPTDANARVLLARLVYLENKDATAALRYLDAAENLAADPVTVASVRSWVLESEGRLAEANKLLDDLVEREQTPAAQLLRAEFCARTGDLPRAEQDYVALTRGADAAHGYLRLAEFYRDHDRLADAVATLERGSAAFPDDLSLKGTLMNALLARAQGDDAQRGAAILAELEQKLPDAPDVLWVRAQLALREGTPASLDEAASLLKRIVQQQPSHVDAQLALINLSLRRHDRAAARELAAAAVGANPANPQLALARAEVEAALGEPRTAWELARSLLKDERVATGATRILIAAALDAHEPALLTQTQALLEETLARNADDEMLHLGLASVLQARGLIPPAIEHLSNYQQAHDGGSVAVRLLLADLYRAQGDLNAAGAQLDAAAALAPDQPTVAQARIGWLAAQKDYAQVVQLADDQRTRVPENVGVILVAANTLVTAGQKEYRAAAKSLYQHVISAQPRAIEAYVGLGLLVYEDGDAAQAERVFRDALVQDPTNLEALNDLSWILAEAHGDDSAALAEALKLADKAVQLNPDNAHFLDTRGVVLARLPGRLPDARADFERCLRLTAEHSGQRAKAALKLGRTCAQLGDLSAARRYLDEAREIDDHEKQLTPQERRELGTLMDDVSASVASGPAH